MLSSHSLSKGNKASQTFTPGRGSTFQLTQTSCAALLIWRPRWCYGHTYHTLNTKYIWVWTVLSNSWWCWWKRGSHEVLLTGNNEFQHHMMGVSDKTRVGTDKEMLPSIKIDLHWNCMCNLLACRMMRCSTSVIFIWKKRYSFDPTNQRHNQKIKIWQHLFKLLHVFFKS